MRNKTIGVRDKILKLVDIAPNELVEQAVEMLGISRQAVYRHIKALIEEDRLDYKTVSNKRIYSYGNVRELTKTIILDGDVSEYDVYLKYFDWVEKDLADNVKAIIEYGFSEMLNNVIDHSEAETCTIIVKKNTDKIEIYIHDDGEGIFDRITRLKKLSDPRQALLELQKGKLTTDPSNHTGEGIFFSSRAFDEFVIQSGGLLFLHKDIHKNNYLLENAQSNNGTNVIMTIKTNSKTELPDIFDDFAEADEYSFNKTIVPIRLAKMGNENLVSRSQAKRVLLRLENFKTIIFDFVEVDRIGQAFADEIFRVYQNKHKDIALKYTNTTKAVEQMIQRAYINNKQSE